MYLSRVELDTSLRLTQLAISSPSKLHGAIEESFPVRQERNLWRIDTLYGRTYLLLLSKDRPILDSLTAQFGKQPCSAETKNYDPLLARITNDSKWRFRLVANPTHQKKESNGRGKVVAHVTPEYQMSWLEKKGEEGGFRILPDDCVIKAAEWRDFAKQNKAEAAKQFRVRFLQVAYEGVLCVTEAEAFRKVLTDGIGRGKAYGAGLMTVAGLNN